jgi:phage-related baseplate assembly protein
MSDLLDLSLLPAPALIEELDYATIRQALIDDLTARDPSFAELLESDPGVILLEVVAWRELLIRQRVNDAGEGNMLAFATGSDLEQLGGLFNVGRLTIVEADPLAEPPVVAVLESDTALRRRIQLALEGVTTAGSRQSYLFHALSADADVRDVAVISPSPSEIVVTVLSHANDGVAAAEVLSAVSDAVNEETVRPLGDRVTVQAAELIDFDIEARLTILAGPDGSVVREAADLAVRSLGQLGRPLGRSIRISALLAALHVEGVERVQLDQPLTDVEVLPAEAARLGNVTLTIGVA